MSKTTISPFTDDTQPLRTSLLAGAALVIDIETFSTLDLKKVGVWRYAEDPQTDVHCVCSVLGGAPVETWVRGNPVPISILEAIADPNVLFVAHNAQFERAIWLRVLAARHRWPPCPPVERWRDTMTFALALGLPAELKLLAQVLKLDHQKADDGIMHLMCKPRRARIGEDPNKGPYWHEEPEVLQKLCAYCADDVLCERDAYNWLPPLCEREQGFWEDDQRINARGWCIDAFFVERAIKLIKTTERGILDEFRQITKSEVQSFNQRDKLLNWYAAARLRT
jgi:DNA polymerase